MNSNKYSPALPFWLFTFALITALIVSQLIQDGVFMDGMLYISVAKNLADGLGSFWNPHFSQTLFPNFHEQPPLYFGLLAMFYKILGTSMYVERIFDFTCFLATAFYIKKIWQSVYSDDASIAGNSWLPVLFWTSIPVCFWTYTNHVEETLMSVFTIASGYHSYKALFVNNKTWYHLLLAGIFIFLSSLTKGIQGIYPLVAAGIYWMVFRNISFGRMLSYSLVLIGIPALIYGFLLVTNPEVYVSYAAYFESRFTSAFNGSAATTGSHFYMLFRLVKELFPVVLISCLFLFVTRKKKNIKELEKGRGQTILWFVLMGLAGSMPLMVTLEQRGFYMVTTLSFFAIAISMWIAPRVSSLINRTELNSIGFKRSVRITAFLLAGCVVFTLTQIGRAKRDKDLLSDIYLCGKVIPEGEIIGIPTEMFSAWNLQAYCVRYFYWSLDHKAQTKNKYFMINKELPQNLVPEGYKLLTQLKTKTFNIYVLE